MTFRMRRYTFWMLLALVALSVACSKSDDDNSSVTTDECYISSFVLGQMRRAITVKDSQGGDSTYYVSFTGSYYPLIIDQRASTISLAKPLPMGTRINAVLTTISFEGAVMHTPVTDTTAWTAYNSRDSVDFSVPRIYRVYATNGDSYRDYTVSLSVRDNDAEGYTWTRSDGVELQLLDILYFNFEPNEAITAEYDVLARLDYVQTNNNGRVLLACRRKGNGADVPLAIWSLLMDTGEEWTLFTLSTDNPYGLVVANTPHLVAYGDEVMAFEEGSRRILVSPDNGITWKRKTTLYIPSDIEVTQPDGTPLPMFAASNGEVVWLKVGEEVWQLQCNE